jgi:hypothetical protein
MTIDTISARSRRLARTAAATLGLTLGSLAAPAFAAPPETWEVPESGSLLDDLLFIVGVPVLVFVLLTLLVYLPSMMRRHSSEPSLAFRDRPEWFGGPRKGLDATTATTTGTGGSHAADKPGKSDKGGASARW